MPKKKAPPIIGAFDCETNPFDYESTIKPFCFGIAWVNPKNAQQCYRDFWDDNCALDFVEWLQTMPPMLLYAHNGGKFDFLFLLDHITDPFLIGSRIVKAKIHHHEIRDSYSILPISLKQYAKDEIDYLNFTPEKREQYRNDILEYLASDCEYLLELVIKFREKFGNKLTIASTAIAELEKLHTVEHKRIKHDLAFRDYYLGGRVECFEYGHCQGDFKIYDVNSMYPYAMREFKHPRGDWEFSRDLDYCLAAPVAFVEATVTAVGLGVRSKLGLEWGKFTGRMKMCTHEMRPAIARGELIVHEVHSAKVFQDYIQFEKFVDYWMQEKIRCELAGDKAGRIFAKLILNSAYGKLAQNPEQFKEYKIVYDGNIDSEHGDWEYYDQFGKHEIYRRPNPSERGYIDVSLGASITSASRATLAAALAVAVRPIYCDTDSIICQDLPLDLHPTKLGAWKTEAECSDVYIAGKKLYAAFNGSEVVKTAAKGSRLEADEIKRVALGEEILWRSESPTFKFNHQNYMVRKITRRF